MGGLNQHTDNNDTRIQGATDSTEIGNSGDRLKTEATFSPLSQTQVIPFTTKVLNASSPDMNVDGSSTPVTFSAGPTTTSEQWFVTRISVILDDSGNLGRGDFGAIASGLTNGVLARFTVNSTNYDIALFKKNQDLIIGADVIERGANNQFINDANFVVANTILRNNILLDEATSDQFKIIIQDNLTGLDLFQVAIGYVIEV